MDYVQKIASPIGLLTVSSDGGSLTGLWVEGQKHFGGTLKHTEETASVPLFDRVQKWLSAYFARERPEVDFPLAPSGSAFRQDVWRLLCEIPYGQVTTYGKIAEKLKQRNGGLPTSARAVGGAVGHNPISIIIPCHRVVGADGSLTGYAGGLAVKTALLTLEEAYP